MVLLLPPAPLAHGGDRPDVETPPPGGVRSGDIGDVGDVGAGPRTGDTAGDRGFPKGALLLKAAGSTVGVIFLSFKSTTQVMQAKQG